MSLFSTSSFQFVVLLSLRSLRKRLRSFAVRSSGEEVEVEVEVTEVAEIERGGLVERGGV